MCAAFVRHHELTMHDLQQVFDDVFRIDGEPLTEADLAAIVVENCKLGRCPCPPPAPPPRALPKAMPVRPKARPTAQSSSGRVKEGECELARDVVRGSSTQRTTRCRRKTRQRGSLRR